jgi:hypothetical protein
MCPDAAFPALAYLDSLADRLDYLGRIFVLRQRDTPLREALIVVPRFSACPRSGPEDRGLMMTTGIADD